MEELQVNKAEASGLSIRDLFYKYIRFLPLFILSVALALVVAYMYLRYATEVYSSAGTMAIQDDQSRSSGANTTFDQFFQANDVVNIQNEIEYIKSREIMSRVVAALNLNWSYFSKGKIKELNIYKSSPFEVEAFEIIDSSSSFTLEVSFSNENNFTINGNGPFTFGQVVKNDNGVFKLIKSRGNVSKDYEVHWEPTRKVAARLAGITVTPKQNTGILTLSMEATNPQMAADVINQVMVEYQKATVEDKNASTQAKLAFIDSRGQIIEAQIDSIIQVQSDFMKRNKLIDPQTQSTSYFGRIENASAEALAQKAKLDNAFLIERYIRNKSGDVPVPSSLGLEDPTLNTAVAAYNQAQLELKSLKETAPPGNAIIQQHEEVVSRLQGNILESLENIKTAYRNSISSLNSVSAGAQAQLSQMPEKQQELAGINRLLENKLTVYNALLEERERSAIIQASTVSDIKVLTEASPNNTPVKPNRTSIQIMSIVIGLLLPAAGIFLVELMNDKVTTRHDIEKITSATIIGEVGHSYGRDNLVVTGHNRSVVAEQFRIIRSNLQYVLNHIPKPVILVTSSFSGEGKSFISTNMGAVLAVAGKKTVILEFDIRKPKILSHLNMSKSPGLTNYLLGKARLEDLFVPVDASENLFVLPCGPVPPNPAEILLDPKLNELFDYLRAHFDAVIMDTAPVGMVSDAMTLSKFADATLYIVRQGHTYKKQIGLIDEFYSQGKLPKISIVLNDVKIRTGYGYYGYGRYGYGYGYGSGYFEDDTPPPGMLSRWFGWLDTRKWNKNKKRKRAKV